MSEAMPIKNLERRRAAGREATRRYRQRHPEREAAYRQTEAFRESRRRYRVRNLERVRAADRAAHRRLRQHRAALAAVPPGQSRGLDALRAQLRGTRGAERERIEAAIIHLQAVILGQPVKARDPERLRLRPDVGSLGFNVRARPAAGVLDE
jgi:hypothetical protein